MKVIIQKKPVDFKLHPEFVAAFAILGYEMLEAELTVEEEQIFDTFFTMKIDHPEDAAKGKILFDPGCNVHYIQKARLLVGSILWDLKCVIKYYADVFPTVQQHYDEAAMQAAPFVHNPMCTLVSLRSAGDLGNMGSDKGTDTAPAKQAPAKLLQSVSLNKFSWNDDEWMNWEMSTKAKLQSGGAEKILEDKTYADKNPVLDGVVAGLLKDAFSINGCYLSAGFTGDADSEEGKSGYAMWQRIKKLYENEETLSILLEEQHATFDKLQYSWPNGDFKTFAFRYLTLKHSIERLTKKALAANIDCEKIINFRNKFLDKLSKNSELSAHVVACRQSEKELWHCIYYIRAAIHKLDRNSNVARHKGNSKADNKRKHQESKSASEVNFHSSTKPEGKSQSEHDSKPKGKRRGKRRRGLDDSASSNGANEDRNEDELTQANFFEDP